MIAFLGYNGFLYSIGYLTGWIVALFVVAEPLKKADKDTFTDALDIRFNSKSIQLMAAISTLVMSVCYLIPQIVGACALITSAGHDSLCGVILVGGIVLFLEEDISCGCCRIHSRGCGIRTGDHSDLVQHVCPVWSGSCCNSEPAGPARHHHHPAVIYYAGCVLFAVPLQEQQTARVKNQQSTSKEQGSPAALFFFLPK